MSGVVDVDARTGEMTVNDDLAAAMTTAALKLVDSIKQDT